MPPAKQPDVPAAQLISVTPDPQLPGLPEAQQDEQTRRLRARLAAALLAQGAKYSPRTEHLEADGAPKFTNRLILETSPYLLQHAHNPVNWYAWGEEAFSRARAENKPVLMSVGYSTCHWCHVMERESFENAEIAAFINANFIAIKVDREQRPDVDEVYMAAVTRLTGSGGWPMTVIMTPDARPFFGGTYFPPFDGSRGARKGFLTILKEIASEYNDDPKDLFSKAAALSQELVRETRMATESTPGFDALARANMLLGRRLDTRWGGFGQAPKFPRPTTLDFLLRWQRRAGDSAALSAVTLTLDKMIDGGIHDQIGGGFHRYSTDAHWLVPHFEKMLYDNGQIIVTLLELYQASGNARYAEVARETIDYVMRELSDPSGGFHSATDADSPVPERPEHREEGLFFTWTPGELDQHLGADLARKFAEFYGVTKAGNFEGRSILHVKSSVQDVAASLGTTATALASDLAGARKRLYDVRSKRLAPLLDDKVLCSWNGLMLSALARGALVLGDDSYRERAVILGNWLLRGMRDQNGRLVRSARHGVLGARGYLDDYAFVIQGLLDLFEAHADRRWLDGAIELQRQLDEHHANPEGGYFTTPNDAPALLVRQSPSYDGAEPSGNSVAMLNLLRLAAWTEKADYETRAVAAMDHFAAVISRNPTSVPKMLSALDFSLDEVMQIFIISPTNADKVTLAGRDALIEVLRASYVPNRILQVIDEHEAKARESLIPALEGKVALGGRATAYVCEKRICQLPTSKPAQFAKQLKRVHVYSGIEARSEASTEASTEAGNKAGNK